MREETKHHDSDLQREERRRFRRKSIGSSIITSFLSDPPWLPRVVQSESLGVVSAESA